MLPALTTEQMTEVDRLMIEEYGIRLIQMMENAGRNLAEQARRLSGGDLRGKGMAVLCGGGNNGGGGMVAARHLHNRGAVVWAKLLPDEDRLKDISAHQWRILKTMGVPTIDQPADLPHKADLVIDAMIGYGLQGDPRGLVVEWVDWANNSGAPILALDTPSGLDTTTGIPGTPCIQAAATLTLALPKTGLFSPEARSYVGELFLADISVPPGLYGKLGIKIGSVFAPDTIIKVEGV
jgi:NAD(P)H-hydrate epimerase